MDRLWYALAAIAALLGAALIIRSLFLDRARGRKRCPKCWYDISANAERSILTCPECGRVSKSPKQLTRTRRHRRRAALGALIVLLALCGVHWLRVRDDVRLFGWEMAVPVSILVWIAPVDPEPFRLSGSYTTDHWSKFEWDLHTGVILRDEDHPTLVRIYYWRQDGAIKKRGMLGVDPRDTELVRRMFEDRIEPISGTMTVKQAFDILSKRVNAPIDLDWDYLREEWSIVPDTVFTLPDVGDTLVSPAHMMEEIIAYTTADPSRNWLDGSRWDVADGSVVLRGWDQEPRSMRVIRYSVDSLVRYDVWCFNERYQKLRREHTHDFQGLVSEGDEVTQEEVIAGLLWQFIDVYGWKENGGPRGEIAEYSTRNLLILTTPRNHYEIKQLLDELTRRIPRGARGDFVLPTSPRRVPIDN